MGADYFPSPFASPDIAFHTALPINTTIAPPIKIISNTTASPPAIFPADTYFA